MNQNEIKKKYEGIQTKLKEIYNGGCLFLSLCSIIDYFNPCDILTVIQKAMDKGWLLNDYTVKDSLSLLDCFTGKKWHRRIVSKLPTVIKDNEFTIEKWYNPMTGFTHFKRRFVDTLISSVTVKEGHIKEYYIYYY